MYIQESVVYEPAHTPVKCMPIHLIAADAHELKQLVVRYESRLKNLAKNWNILASAD